MSCLRAVGAAGTEEFMHTVFAVVEVIAQHPTILIEYHQIVIEKILPPLAQLVSSSVGTFHKDFHLSYLLIFSFLFYFSFLWFSCFYSFWVELSSVSTFYVAVFSLDNQ